MLKTVFSACKRLLIRGFVDLSVYKQTRFLKKTLQKSFAMILGLFGSY